MSSYQHSMGLLSRNVSVVDRRNDGDIYSDIEYQRLPRNPVFYPLTPMDIGTGGGVFKDESFDSADKRRSSRLVSRIKMIFSVKGPPTSPKQRFTGNHHHHTTDASNIEDVPHNGHRRKIDQRSPQRPKLVARSPLREACISPDFFALADIDCLHITSPSDHDKQHTDSAAARRLKRRNFTTSVFLPNFSYNEPAGRGHSRGSSAATTAVARGNLSPFLDTSCSQRTKHGVSRSASLMSSRKMIPPMLVPSLSTLPQLQCQKTVSLEPHEESARRHRDSRGSETTAVLGSESSSASGDHLCDMELPSLSPSKQFKTSSPSQKTLSGICTTSEEFINNAFAASMLAEDPLLEMAFDKEADVFQTFSKLRRPYSEGFPEQSPPPTAETNKQPILGGNSNISCIVVPMNSQWAMYARSSYAESGLVKSTFDLAKLLPSAPQ